MKTIYKYMCLGLMSVALPLTLAGCSDDDEKLVKGTQITVCYNGKSIDAPLEFSLGAGFQMLSVSCDGDWTATLDDTSIEYDATDSVQLNDGNRWISLSNHAGYPDRVVTDEDTTYCSWVKLQFKYNESEDRTANITFRSGDVSKTICISQQGAGADPGDFFMTAYMLREQLGIGYNLGNTLESDPDITLASTKKWFKNYQNDLAWETIWGQPVTTQELIDTIVSRGFNIVRVPVTWFPHMDEDGTIREVWMNRVQEVVDYVVSTGAYCIINVMHDTGAANGRTDGGGWLKADLDDYPTSTIKYQNIWQQVATRFRDYDEHLLFESFNEILDNDDNWGDPSKSTAYTAINKLQQDFVNTVRATGGNNEYRNLLITTYGAGHSQAKLDGFQVPTDVHRGHLMATIHSYDPYNFCNDNGEWNVFMFDDACKKEIDDMFSMINSRFNELGIPYIFGEFGAIDEEYKDMGERVKYAQYLRQKFEDYNTTGLWWMGLINRSALSWYEPEIVSALQD